VARAANGGPVSLRPHAFAIRHVDAIVILNILCVRVISAILSSGSGIDGEAAMPAVA
jgi:hypothetical protein